MSNDYDKIEKLEDDEITLKELILKIKTFYSEVFKNKFIILLISIPFILYFGYKSLKTKTTYTAKLTYMINQNEGGFSALGGLLSQFGIGGEQNPVNKTRIIELGKSEKIINKSLLTIVTIKGKKDYLANHIINNLDTLGLWQHVPFYKKWLSNKENKLVNFRFKNVNPDSLDELSATAIKSLYGYLAGGVGSKGGINTNGFDKESGILYTQTITSDPELSVILTNTIFDNLSEFYIDKTVEKQRFTYNVIKAKTDSLLYLLQGKESGYSSFQDKNIGSWNQTSALPSKRYSRDIQKLTLMYAESLKNLELADFALKNVLPFIQPIDRPFLPLQANSNSFVMSLIKGFFLGIFIGVAFVVARKLYFDAMNN